jgi:hypothetical protein
LLITIEQSLADTNGEGCLSSEDKPAWDRMGPLQTLSKRGMVILLGGGRWSQARDLVVFD